MSRQTLIDMARHNMGYAKDGTVEQTDEILHIPVEHYYDTKRWAEEMDRVFRRMPLVVAFTCEMSEPGDYRAVEAAGMPILVTRGEDGEVRAFVNTCSHRGSQIMMEGTGNATRFTCPYHAWSYNTRGELTGVYAPNDFGELDKSAHGLPALPVLERAGLIWVIPNPDATLDIETFLCGYDKMLGHFNFEQWHLFERRTLRGPNWKVAYDGYLDLYHLPILHKDTFGNQFPNQALYYAWGPHQRVSSPDPSLLQLDQDRPETWDTAHLLSGVWTIFPHVSIAGFDGGGRGVMVSQLFPGETPEESFTVQNYLMEREPDDAAVRGAHQQFKLLEYVVTEEDYATGLRQQKALKTGANTHVMFGRNEAGGQRFHGWVEKLLDTDDKDLTELFAAV